MSRQHLKEWGMLAGLTAFVVWAAVWFMVPDKSTFSFVAQDVVPWDQLGIPTEEIVSRHATFVAEYQAGGPPPDLSQFPTVEAIVTRASIYRQGQTATAMHSTPPTTTAQPEE
ncbi:MAG TPA: hypothetical protein VND68_10120 [Chloroflexia bacterium]|jgi:hypothetical protein|nr:hypothetical protein [Chloroflexia bacterium]